jgi:hypothetical protein
MIDYGILDASVKHYENKGFKRIESPWTVTAAISAITKPIGCSDFTIAEKNKVLVASGEQSFLCLYNKGFLPKGKFQTITPCFRDESFDSFHTKYFIKNELIITDRVDRIVLQNLIGDAMAFFGSYLHECQCEPTGENMYDIMYKDIELGSYGIRKCEFLTWIYGTGVAEPRLSSVMKKYGIPNKQL